jgi:hypothetical protein
MPMPVSATAISRQTRPLRSSRRVIDTSMCPRFGELDGVADQVGQDLAHPQRVSQEALRYVRSHAEHQLQLFFAGPLPDQRIDVAQHIVDPERDRFNRQLAGLDLRKIEDVVDDAEQ